MGCAVSTAAVTPMAVFPDPTGSNVVGVPSAETTEGRNVSEGSKSPASYLEKGLPLSQSALAADKIVNCATIGRFSEQYSIGLVLGRALLPPERLSRLAGICESTSRPRAAYSLVLAPRPRCTWGPVR